MSEKENLILASLLHDIGKFAVLGGEKLSSEYDKNLRNIYCPNKYGYNHLLYSGQFVKEVFEGKASLIENLVLSHHIPENFQGNKKLPKIIQIADWLSSGERRGREDKEGIEFKKEPIISIFSQLNTNNLNFKELYNKPVKIEGNLDNLIPVEKNFALNEEYNFVKLWNDFKEETKYISYSTSFEKLFNQVFSLLEKYTIFIPSAYFKDKPEISLFHHLKSTCAISTCLYDLNVEETKLNSLIDCLKNFFEKRRTNEKIEEKDYEILRSEDFILLKGDISGIQNFIYSVTSEHALKGLRGRSFYLQLISEMIAYRILEEFNMPKSNLLYIGGGNFIILLSNLKDIKNKMESLIKEIDEIIFKSHQGQLGIIVSYINFSYADFITSFRNSLAKLGEKLAVEKKKKFKYILNEKIFEPYPEKIEKEMKGCSICGKETHEGYGKCPLCESFENLATLIKNGKFLEIKKCGSKKSIKDQVNSWDEIFEALGYKINFSQDTGGIKIALNNAEFLKGGCEGFKFEAIHSPEGTLEDIGNMAEGIKRWGALRMDVDNLGLIFSDGFTNEKGEDETTISRYSMLSYSFSLFFSLGIRDIVEKKYKNKCCVVYSGGDDLFIIAPWNDLPIIAKEIYEKFRSYTCNHPKITISGGIYIAPSSKFPVYQAAKRAGEEENKAKTGEKNKITFLETPLRWEDELKSIEEVKDNLYELLKENGEQKVSRSILTILYSGYKEKELVEKGKIPFVRIWRIFYGLKRFMERHKGLEKEIVKIRERFITENFELTRKLDVAVRWAELLTRKQKDESLEKSRNL